MTRKPAPSLIAALCFAFAAPGFAQAQDGTEENHRSIDSRDPDEPGNLARWILSL
jgi:hypothetical protein